MVKYGAIGASLLFSGVAAYVAYKYLQKGTSPTLRDPHFNTENIALYSSEAEKRAEQLSNVEYKMLLKLTDAETTGFQGSIEVLFNFDPS